jgi:predicted 2-oxoglutarate/Fe(II)-dependent dioxygenase YbiX
MPAGDALALASAVGETDFPVDSGVIEELKGRQAKLDKQADEKHELEMELLRAQIEQTKNAAANPSSPALGKTAPKPKKDDEGKGHSYNSRLEQKTHEKVAASGKSFERMQKAQS